MTIIRDFFRRRRVGRHLRDHGPVFEFHGLTVRGPDAMDIALANALMKSKYEVEEADFVRTHLPSDRPVIELGGSLGAISALIGSRLEPGVPHLVVEANPELVAICQENASQNGARPDTRVIGAALSYGGTDVSFTIGANQHVSRLTSTPGKVQQGRRVTVATITLAALHAQLGAPDGYSLVCDIEGAEAEMVARDAAVLRQAGFILLETHPRFYGGGPEEAKALCAGIEALGFETLAASGDVVVFRRL
ncbi:MAG: FkbM family methyltransferase [Jannaschia sp.]